jgi:hypothetical protein
MTMLRNAGTGTISHIRVRGSKPASTGLCVRNNDVPRRDSPGNWTAPKHDPTSILAVAAWRRCMCCGVKSRWANTVQNPPRLSEQLGRQLQQAPGHVSNALCSAGWINLTTGHYHYFCASIT